MKKKKKPVKKKKVDVKRSKAERLPRKGPAADPGSAAQPAASNPYDVFQNRRCRKAVLGEKVSGSKRNAARSRAKAAVQRTQGLVRESLMARRTSNFKDGRLSGESVNGETGYAVQRLVKLRQKQMKRSFTLDKAAGDTLMHGGKPLSEMPDAELRNTEGMDEDDDEAGFLDADGIIDQRMQKKKDERLERQEREQARSKFDLDFGDLRGELNFRPTKIEALRSGTLETGLADQDGYDSLVRQLAFDRKAMATERTKTPEELARERAEKLEQLEQERRKRAEADGADDGDDAPKEDEMGKTVILGRPVETASRKEDSADEEDEEDCEEEEEGEGEESEEECSEEGEDEEEACENEDVDQDDNALAGAGIPSLLSAKEARGVDLMANGAGEKGLSYSFDCPRDAQGVEALLGQHPPKTALKIVQRVRACTAVALDPSNRASLRLFFVALLDYVIKVMARSDGDISVRGLTLAYALRVPLVELAGEHPEEAYAFFTARLQAMSPGTLPRAAVLACLKLIALLFPVTDFQHPIATPAALLADHWAARIAGLGSAIADLISDALLLWEVLYEFTVPAQRYCASFYQLGVAILASCWTSAAAGRLQCDEAAADVGTMLLKSLRALAQGDRLAALVAANELVRPPLLRLATTESARGLLARLDEWRKEAAAASPPPPGADSGLADGNESGASGGGLAPLTLFEEARPQIRLLDPIFHAIGDRASTRGAGAGLSESKLLQRQLTRERRTAGRQLARDATALQQLQGRKDSKRRAAQTTERVRVRSMMDAEKTMLKQMMTEVSGGMDTSLKRYSKGKEEKRANPRLGGNATTLKADDGKKTKRGAPDAGGAAKAGAKVKKAKKGGKK